MVAITALCFDTLVAKFLGSCQPEYPLDDLFAEYPIFVTWTIGADEELRGCIGTFEKE
jgi:AMMECR1 domain-containing protein